MNEVTEHIFSLLKERQIEQKEFANLVGTTDKTVSAWKTGRSQSYMKYLPKIADVLGTSVDYLLGGSRSVIVGEHVIPPKNSIKELWEAAEVAFKVFLNALHLTANDSSYLAESKGPFSMVIQAKLLVPEGDSAERSNIAAIDPSGDATGDNRYQFNQEGQTEAKKKAPPVSGEAMEVAEAYDAADPYVQLGVRKLLDLDAQKSKIRIAARRSDGPRTSTGPDTDVEI